MKMFDLNFFPYRSRCTELGSYTTKVSRDVAQSATYEDGRSEFEADLGCCGDLGGGTAAYAAASAFSPASNMTPTGASLPVHSSKEAAPWYTSIQRPPRVAAPTLRASSSSGVSAGA